MIIIEPAALSGQIAYPLVAPFPAITANAGGGAVNLASYDPREIWSLPQGQTANIYIDFGSMTQWDTLILVNVRGGGAATWQVKFGSAASANNYNEAALTAVGPMLLATEDGLAAGVALARAGAPISSRYVLMSVTQPAGAGPLSVGAVCIGMGYAPGYGREPGAGRPSLDSGARERLPDGGLATVSGALISGFKWVYGDLSESDLAKLWGIWRRRRTTEPIVVVEDISAPVAEGVHYGTFLSLDAYERSLVSKSRWVMSMEDWVGG